MIELIWYGIALFQVHINPRIPPKWQRKLAERRVIRQIQRAYKDVPYYRKRYDEAGVDISSIRHIEDLKKLPCITKEEVRQNFPEGMLADGVDIDRCHYSATAGSTGKPLSFIFSKATFAFYILTSVRVYTMIGYRPWHKMCYIKYTAVDAAPHLNMGPFFRQSHISSNIPVEEQIARLREEKPDLLIGYSSSISEIARYITPEDRKHFRPKFISVNSGMSTQEERKYISSVFDCPVYDEYSTEETWMISSQCHHNNYHLFTDNVWVEFLDEEGNDVTSDKTGEIVLTTMRSPAMPFIRYRIGDLGRPSDRTCPCGRSFPLMESLEGRSNDSFILPSGRFISPSKIHTVFYPFIKKYPNTIEQFKVIQKEKGLIVIQLVKGKEYSEDRFKEVIDRLHEIFDEPVTITVEMVEEIPKKYIKRKAIESWVEKSR
ncbi:MAG: hypothetical protein SVM80_00300 [Halobacteriota archaeon]|nr:hypothetical protein [Halobacteriota archaeon]